MRKSYVVVLSPEERDRLEKLISTGRTSSKRQVQARILLKADTSEAGPGWSDEQIGEALETSVSTVARVRKRSVEQGLAGVSDRAVARRPSRRRLDGEQEARLLAVACSPAPAGRARWTLRLLADKIAELEVVSFTKRLYQKHQRSAFITISVSRVHPCPGINNLRHRGRRICPLRGRRLWKLG